MSPFAAMAANLQVSPHLYSLPSSSHSSRAGSGGGGGRGSVPPPRNKQLLSRTLLCQRRPDEAARLRRYRTAPQAAESEGFASISSRSSKETTSVGVPPQPPVPPPPSSFGSPLFWIGVGVGVSALFSWVANYLKKYAMQQAFKAMMGQMNSQNNQFAGSPFSSASPSPFPMGSAPRPTPSSMATSQPSTVDISATKVEAVKAETAPVADVKDEIKKEEELKRYAFVDISPEETKEKSPFESFKDVTETTSSEATQFVGNVPQNGSASKSVDSSSEASESTGKGNPVLSVDALEKMMEDPTVQKMVFPHLPEEMRNPETFRWMLQNPQYRQQLEEMLNNMGGSSEWDGRMMDSLKNFDLSSPEVKQQFDQIGLTPEEVISKIMANPEVAMAFQNPRVQQAIMDCSQNPLSIAKYQNDKEVMDVFNKISELFPGVTGP
ncbi:hypothetical protein ACJRO7_002108 [Eucalyptus globulus]|uniref:Protein TIC 40, chloroplastic n=1 Tax=Eucalyptus globulus TaxID=34317 RepID=A0ABD3LTA6_EUCGL